MSSYILHLRTNVFRTKTVGFENPWVDVEGEGGSPNLTKSIERISTDAKRSRRVDLMELSAPATINPVSETEDEIQG